MSDQHTVYGLRLKSRAVAPVLAETEKSQFIVGTCQVNGDNEVHLLEFQEEYNGGGPNFSSTIYRHPHEIWSLSPSPRHADLVFSCYSLVVDSAMKWKTTLWRIPASSRTLDGSGRKAALEELVTLDAFDGAVKCVLWNPEDSMPDQFATVDDSAVSLWTLCDGRKAADKSQSLQVAGNKGQIKFTNARWNPHNINEIVTANDMALRGWDIRASKPSFVIDQANDVWVRDLDFNPNKPHHIATVGDDCKLRFYDTRNTKTPLKETMSHSHWAWSVQYNRFHDELVLTSGSDCKVNLHGYPSISSSPGGSSGPTSPSDAVPTETGRRMSKRSSSLSPSREVGKEKLLDGLMWTVDQHEDSIYSTCWSAADPWLFASLSYDGRMVVSTVPNEQKYKVIL